MENISNIRISVVKNRNDYTANCYVGANYYSRVGKTGPSAIQALRALLSDDKEIEKYDRSVGRIK